MTALELSLECKLDRNESVIMGAQPTRRHVLAGMAAAGVNLAAVAAQSSPSRPAILGGKPVRTKRFPTWPIYDDKEERELAKVGRSGRWYRGSGQTVHNFEEAFGKLLGAKYSLATSSGTGALVTSLHALDVQAGDEVLLPSYTFVACVNAVLARNALPVFVDVDPETFLMDPRRIEAAITDRTTAIMPVHIGGAAADMDGILSISQKRNIPVVEDACQAHLAEWRGHKLGTLGHTGCFSFQASKNLTCGEGGFVVTNDPVLKDRCFAYHWNGALLNKSAKKLPGCKFMMTEFQAAVLLSQLTRLEEQSQRRTDNANFLIKLLGEVPGITPVKQYEGCTRNSYHLFMMRYDKAAFADLPREKFLKALSAEGVPASGGYQPLHSEPFIRETIESRGYRRLLSSDRITQWKEQNVCPSTDRICSDAVWLSQNLLLGTREDMTQIAEAMSKIRRHAGELARV